MRVRWQWAGQVYTPVPTFRLSATELFNLTCVASTNEGTEQEDDPMKTTILAGLLALSAAMAAAAPAGAASLSITLGDNGPDYYGDAPYHGWRNYHRGWRNDHGGWRHGMTVRRPYRECTVTTHRYWSHGRRIVERVRDCD